MNYNIALVQLPLVNEPGTRRLLSPEDAWCACSDIAGLAQESFHVLTLNGKNLLINRHLVSLGLADSALAHPREIFRPAVCDGAAAIVLVHNHPSGDPTPSAEDVRITKQMVEAGKIMGINVVDHIIIGRQAAAAGGQSGRPAYLSLRENGLCSFA